MAAMMVGTEFRGDNNHALMEVQHAVYGEMVVRLYAAPRDQYQAAVRLLRVESELSQRLRSMDGLSRPPASRLPGRHSRLCTELHPSLLVDGITGAVPGIRLPLPAH